MNPLYPKIVFSHKRWKPKHDEDEDENQDEEVVVVVVDNDQDGFDKEVLNEALMMNINVYNLDWLNHENAELMKEVEVEIHEVMNKRE